MTHKLCRVCLAVIVAAAFISWLAWLFLSSREQACQEAADIVAAVRVCQQREVMCWSTPGDLADMRRALRRLEDCKT